MSKSNSINILDSILFKRIMYFKFFMVICIWGLTPLLIPQNILPLLGLQLNQTEMLLLRIWGIIVLLDFFVYWYIFKKPHTKLAKYLILFAVLDNAGFGLILLVLTPIFKLPWGIWVNIPFQLFFGYCFWRFLKEGTFEYNAVRKSS